MIGILGGGQLARMMILAGTPLGLKFRIFSEKQEEPTLGLADTVIGPYDDVKLQAKFSKGLSVVTYEFENIPVECVRSISKHVNVEPTAEALRIGQDRAFEKELFVKLGIPTTNFIILSDLTDVPKALGQVGTPAVIKTTRLGYDGKGQRLIKTKKQNLSSLSDLHPAPYIVEGFVDFERELSIVGVRGKSGEIQTYSLVENLHEDGILRRSIAPAQRCERLGPMAIEYITRVMESLDYIGVLAIEFFEVGGNLIANEIAPRVHNTGHWTIEGAVTSQFENHLRAITGLPLGSTEAVGGSVLLNLIGKVPAMEEVLKYSGAHLHLYGKSERPGRKVGHTTFHAPSVEKALALAKDLKI